MSIIRTIVFVLVTLMLTLYTWLGGGIIPRWILPWAPWLTLLILEVMFLFPEQRRTETLLDARSRVWTRVWKDPLTWCSILLIFFLTLQWFNSYTFLAWDPTEKAWEVVSPAFEWLRHPKVTELLTRPPADPSTVSFLQIPDSLPLKGLPHGYRSDEAASVLAWFAPILVALIAMKHATLRHSKRMLCTVICAMTSLLALAGIVQYVVGGTFLYWGKETHAFFFATFGYPNHAACFFPAVMTLSIGMLLWAIEHREHTRIPPWLYVVSVFLCAISAILSGSRAGVLFTLAIVGFCAIYIPIRYLGSMTPRMRIAIPTILLFVALITIGTAAFRVYAVNSNLERSQAMKEAATPEEYALAFELPAYREIPMIDPVLKEIADTDWASFIEHPMLMRAGYQGILAERQLKDYPWFGAGAWSFRWLNINYINKDDPTEKQWLVNRKGVGQANVHNDTLQFLAEHGWIGFGLMIGCIIALAIPFWKALLRSPSIPMNDIVADRAWLNRICAYCVFAFVATSLIAAHSFIDLVFRSPACMMLYGLLFICADGFVPQKRAIAPSANTTPSA